MNTKTIISIVVLAALGIGGVFAANFTRNQTTDSSQATDTSTIQRNLQTPNSQTTQSQQSGAQSNNESGSNMADEHGKYVPYSEAALANAAANGGRTVLFFHADWCPQCRATEADIQANRENIPEDLTILKIDYDTATALKQQYNIVSQDTLVQIDAAGNPITQWNSGGQGLGNIIQNLKEA